MCVPNAIEDIFSNQAYVFQSIPTAKSLIILQNLVSIAM